MRGKLLLILLPTFGAGCRQAANRGTLYDTAEATVTRGDSVFVSSGSLDRRTVYLPDSSKVVLNPGSQIDYPSSFGRAVWLDGDAYFEVHPTAVPLVIHTQNLVLEGNAAFRVSAFSKDDGESVEVSGGQIRAVKSYASKDHDPETLGPGEMVMVNQTIDLMEKETFDTTELQVWKTNSLSFDHTSLDAVVRRSQDWFGVTITVTGDAHDITLTGTFTRLDQILEALAQTGNGHFTIRKYLATLQF